MRALFLIIGGIGVGIWGSLLGSPSAQAVSLFEQSFCTASGCSIPGTPAEIRDRLAAIGRAGPNTPDPNAAGSDGALSLLIPQGRSLQADSATFKDPRIVMTVADEFKSPNAGKIYVSYTKGSGKLEVISWDADAGKYQFVSISNYPQGPLEYRKDRNACTSCHQNGGPIFTPAPWNETNGSLTIARRLCQENGNRPTYEGIAFADRCPEPTHGNPTATTSRVGRLASAAFDRQVRAAAREPQARSACESMCGSNLDCRRALIESALRKPTSSSVIQPPIASEARNPSLFYSNLANRTRSPRQRELAALLQSGAQSTWGTGFAYPSTVLPDRDPTTEPPTVSRITAGPRGERPQPFLNQTINPDFDEARTLGIDLPGTQATSGVQIANEPNATYRGTIADPRTVRPAVSGIPRELAGVYAEDVAFDCLGLAPRDTQTIQNCGSFEQKIGPILESTRVQRLVTDWPLRPDSQGEFRVGLMNAVREACGQVADLTLCPGLIPEVSPQATSGSPTMGRISGGIPAGSTRGQAAALGLVRRYCASCHAAPAPPHQNDDNPNSGYNLPLQNFDRLRAYNAGQPDGLCGKLLSGSMPPATDRDGIAVPRPSADVELPTILQEFGCQAP